MGVKGGSNSSSANNSSVNQNTGQSAGANGSVGMSYGQNQSGNQSQNSSSSSSFGSSQSSQDVWGAQQPHLENVYNSAGDAYANAQAGINNLQPQVSDQMGQALNAAAGGYGNQMGGGFASGPGSGWPQQLRERSGRRHDERCSEDQGPEPRRH